MIITPQALRGIYTAFNTVFNKAFEGQHPNLVLLTELVDRHKLRRGSAFRLLCFSRHL